jgi:hypothetical protein
MNNNLRRIVYKTKTIGSILGFFVSLFQFKLLSFYKEQETVNLIKSVKKEVDFAFYPYEAYMIYSIANSQSKLEGDMAEVGVYQGGSAKLICEAKGDKTLHLFDTFTGLPPLSESDMHFGVKFWKENEFNNTSEDKVKQYLSKYGNVKTYGGKFPETSDPVKNIKFSFVHLDVDLYQSTIDSLEFFYPRLVRGGIIMTHDYHSGGVRKAFEEFFSSKQIPVIELTGSQCMIVKTDS